MIARVDGFGENERAPSGMNPEEWQVVEWLAACHAMMSELSGLDVHRFDSTIQELQEMVLALPAKRAIQCGG